MIQRELYTRIKLKLPSQIGSSSVNRAMRQKPFYLALNSTKRKPILKMYEHVDIQLIDEMETE